MEIKCIKCGREQQYDEFFLRFFSKELLRPIYFCEECENELGGRTAAQDWVMNVFVKDDKKIDNL